MKYQNNIAIVGCAGVPAKYGGFETLAENLVTNQINFDFKYIIYCQKSLYKSKTIYRLDCELIYLNIDANGISSLFYDAFSIFHAVVLKRCKVILCLGSSGSLFLPIFKLFFRDVKFIFNIDGLESRRGKWSFPAKKLLLFLEFIAVKFSDIIISDNIIISKYLKEKYNTNSIVIEYGGDHAKLSNSIHIDPFSNYFLSISRVVPENNIDLILETFLSISDQLIVYIGNWDSSIYGRNLYNKYSNVGNIKLLNPIYDRDILMAYRANAIACIHGHSVGGTNPALVEAVFWARNIFAYDCDFNRETLDYHFSYWKSREDLIELIYSNSLINSSDVIKLQHRYSWMTIVSKYESLY